MDARQHHMQVKNLLARMAIQSPERFFVTFGPNGDATYLADLWDAIGQDLPTDERVPSAGVATWHRSADGQEIIVLKLPPSGARNEAFFVGAVRNAGGCRLFCLERVVLPSTSAEFTILSEMAADGRSNWGPVRACVADEFANLMCRVAADPSARPLSFAPMRLG